MKKTIRNITIITSAIIVLVFGAIQFTVLGQSIKTDIVGDAVLLAPSTIYYVSLQGNDQNPGTAEIPFRTIEQCANIANLNDTCNVMEGTYDERLTISRTGVTFQASGIVTMQGFTITGSNNVVNGFYVLNSTNVEGGIVIKGNNNIVKNNKVERATLVGIQIQGNNHLVENNEVLATQARASSDADGIRFFGDGNIIRGNYIHDLTHNAESVAANAHIDCFQTWNDSSKGIATNTIIENNVCDNRQWFVSPSIGALYGQGFMIDGSNLAHHITIRNNVIRSFQNYILNVPYLTVSNNTLESHEKGATLILQNDPNAIVKNNISYNIYTDPGGRISMCCDFIQPISAGWNWSYNTFGKYYLGEDFKITTDKLGINPLFINASAGDFHLQPNSPACTGGENGSYVGAFPCDVVTITPTP